MAGSATKHVVASAVAIVLFFVIKQAFHCINLLTVTFFKHIRNMIQIAASVEFPVSGRAERTAQTVNGRLASRLAAKVHSGEAATRQILQRPRAAVGRP